MNASSVATAAAPARSQGLYHWYVLLAALDVLVTATVLSLGGAEVNPIARNLLEAFGIAGLVMLKAASVVLVIGVCEIIARRTPARARALAFAAVALSAFPVVVGLTQVAHY
ncbi:MAG: DUF5658 family protein [Phycisphaerales bacterium]